jgi:ribosomal protein L32
MAFKILSLGHLAKGHPQAEEPSLILVCSSCGLIRDENNVSSEQEHWVAKRMYLRTHDGNLGDCHLTHTYCPECFTDFMERVRPGTRSISLVH